MRNMGIQELALLMCVAVFAFVGCATNQIESDESDEEVDGATSALGELACTNTPDYEKSNCPWAVGSNCSAISPDNLYGSADCPNQYAVEIDGPWTHPVTVQYTAGWYAALPDTEGLCNAAHVDLTGYYFDQAGDMWHKVGTRNLVGTWHSVGSWCSFGYANGQSALQKTLNSSAGDDQGWPVTAATAYYDTIFGKVYFPVVAGIKRVN